MEVPHPRTEESDGEENELDTKVVLVGPEREGVRTEPPPPRKIVRVAVYLLSCGLNLEVSVDGRLVFASVFGVVGDLGVRGVPLLAVIVLFREFF